MRGVEYVVDEKGKRKAVLLDLRHWGRLWEDFQDIMVSEERKDDPRVSLEEVKARLQREGY